MASGTAGREALTKVQIGRETTPGTAVAATVIYRALAGHIDNQLQLNKIKENVGILGGTDRTNITKKMAAVALPESEATFEQLPIWFMSGFGGAHAGVADGTSSSGYKYLTNVPTTAGFSLTGKTMTIETGDDIAVREMEHTITSNIKITSIGGEAVKVTVDVMGRQSSSASFTGGLSLVETEDIIASRGKLYLDAVGGSYGSTQISEQLLAVELNIAIKWEPKYTHDGNLYPQFFHYVDHEITGSMTFEHDSTDIVGSGSQYTNWESMVPQRMRLEWLGSALDTPGTGTTFSGVKGFRVDLPIKWDKFDPLTSQNGNSTIVAAFTSRYNATVGNAGSFLIVNELTTLF